MDLSMELNAVSIEDVPGDLDERGIERVPMADPVMDRPFPEVNPEHSPIGQGPHVRRKSVLPGSSCDISSSHLLME
jgi:serine/threonine-protein phosphatase 2A regulatory subunit B'